MKQKRQRTQFTKTVEFLIVVAILGWIGVIGFLVFERAGATEITPTPTQELAAVTRTPGAVDRCDYFGTGYGRRHGGTFDDTHAHGDRYRDADRYRDGHPHSYTHRNAHHDADAHRDPHGCAAIGGVSGRRRRPRCRKNWSWRRFPRRRRW